ncbi:MAG: hypothetical protein ACR2NM_17035, partial [Bythopirellula sp.]
MLYRLTQVILFRCDAQRPPRLRVKTYEQATSRETDVLRRGREPRNEEQHGKSFQQLQQKFRVTQPIDVAIRLKSLACHRNTAGKQIFSAHQAQEGFRTTSGQRQPSEKFGLPQQHSRRLASSDIHQQLERAGRSYSLSCFPYSFLGSR